MRLVSPSPPPRRRGFSLIEVVVAVTIMAVLVSMITVRLSGTRDKQLSLMSDQLRDLLMMYAIRSEQAPDPIAISINREWRTIELVRRTPPTSELNSATWTPDPSVRPIRIPDFIEIEDIEVYSDGDWIDIAEWPLLSMPGENRPQVRIDVTHQERSISLELPPYSIQPRILSGGNDAETSSVLRQPEDLDATGRWQEDW